MSKLLLDRRGFLKGTTASALALGFAPAAFAQATPKRGGHARMGIAGGDSSATINPATFQGGLVVIGMLAVCNNLVEIGADGDAVPELAEEFTSSPDAKTWTFKLRKASFGDGRALTAKDVIASFRHHMGEDTKSSAKQILADVKDIHADGDDVVVFELRAGNADFPFLTSDYQLIIMPANDDGSLNWQSGLGTGGYTLEEYEPGVHMQLKRRDDYWKSDRAWFDQVSLIAINDSAARQNALVTGEVDIINSVPLQTVHLLERSSGVALVESTGTAHFPMPMHCDAAPFSDVNVRLALKHSINREELVSKLLGGHGSIGNDHPIAPAYRYFNPNLEQRAYDPEKAKFYLKKAGMDSLDVTFSTSNGAFEGAVAAASLFQASAAAAGITINIKNEPADGYWSSVWLKAPFCQGFWNGRPTEDSMFSLAYSKASPWNETRWQNERFNELLTEARTELNQEMRAEMYGEMQALCRDDGGAIIPIFSNFIDARSTKINHGPLATNRSLDGWKALERWWFA